MRCGLELVLSSPEGDGGLALEWVCTHAAGAGRILS